MTPTAMRLHEPSSHEPSFRARELTPGELGHSLAPHLANSVLHVATADREGAIVAVSPGAPDWLASAGDICAITPLVGMDGCVDALKGGGEPLHMPAVRMPGPLDLRTEFVIAWSQESERYTVIAFRSRAGDLAAEAMLREQRRRRLSEEEADAARRRSENVSARYRSVVNSTSDGLVVYLARPGADGGRIDITSVNDRARSLLDLAPNDPPNDPPRDPGHDAQRDPALDARRGDLPAGILSAWFEDWLVHLAVPGATIEVTAERLRGDGGTPGRWLRATIVDGGSEGFVLVLTDVTDTVLRDRDVERANRRLQDVLDAIPLGVWLKDGGERIVMANRAAADMMGVEPSAAIGSRAADLLPRGAAPALTGHADPHRTGRSERHVVQRHDPLGGTPGWIDTSVFPLRDPDDEKRVLVVASDVTRFKRVENELRAANEQLDQFAAIASHDLQAPLRRIAQWSAMLRDMQGEADADTAECLDTIEESAARMRGLVGRLLEFSRLNRTALKLETFGLGELIRPLPDIALDDATGAVRVTGDRVLLGQLLANLLQNAARHASAGGTRHPRVRIDVIEQGGETLVRVADDGPGVPRAVAGRIFEPFVRDPSTGGAGDGIGLALCRRIAVAHGGDIRLDQGGESGASFLISLPGLSRAAS